MSPSGEFELSLEPYFHHVKWRVLAENCHAILARAPRFVSESKPQRSLHDAGCTSGNHFSKERIYLQPVRLEPRCRVDARKLGMVERVISFPAQREVALLA